MENTPCCLEWIIFEIWNRKDFCHLLRFLQDICKWGSPGRHCQTQCNYRVLTMADIRFYGKHVCCAKYVAMIDLLFQSCLKHISAVWSGTTTRQVEKVHGKVSWGDAHPGCGSLMQGEEQRLRGSRTNRNITDLLPAQ